MNSVFWCALGLTGIIVNVKCLKNVSFAKKLLNAFAILFSSYILFYGINELLTDGIVLILKNIHSMI